MTEEVKPKAKFAFPGVIPDAGNIVPSVVPDAKNIVSDSIGTADQSQTGSEQSISLTPSPLPESLKAPKVKPPISPSPIVSPAPSPEPVEKQTLIAIHDFPWMRTGQLILFKRDQIINDPLLVKELMEGLAPCRLAGSHEVFVCEKCHHPQKGRL